MRLYRRDCTGRPATGFASQNPAGLGDPSRFTQNSHHRSPDHLVDAIAEAFPFDPPIANHSQFRNAKIDDVQRRIQVHEWTGSVDISRVLFPIDVVFLGMLQELIHHLSHENAVFPDAEVGANNAFGDESMVFFLRLR